MRPRTSLLGRALMDRMTRVDRRTDDAIVPRKIPLKHVEITASVAAENRGCFTSMRYRRRCPITRRKRLSETRRIVLKSISVRDDEKKC